MLRQGVDPAVLAVEVHLHHLGVGSPLDVVEARRHAVAHQIADETLVVVVCDEGPVFGLGLALALFHEADLRREFQLVRLLRDSPCGVAPAADADVLHGNIPAVLGGEGEVGEDVFFFGFNVAPGLRVETDDGKRLLQLFQLFSQLHHFDETLEQHRRLGAGRRGVGAEVARRVAFDETGDPDRLKGFGVERSRLHVREGFDSRAVRYHADPLVFDVSCEKGHHLAPFYAGVRAERVVGITLHKATFRRPEHVFPVPRAGLHVGESVLSALEFLLRQTEQYRDELGPGHVARRVEHVGLLAGHDPLFVHGEDRSGVPFPRGHVLKRSYCLHSSRGDDCYDAGEHQRRQQER